MYVIAADASSSGMPVCLAKQHRPIRLNHALRYASASLELMLLVPAPTFMLPMLTALFPSMRRPSITWARGFPVARPPAIVIPRPIPVAPDPDRTHVWGHTDNFVTAVEAGQMKVPPLRNRGKVLQHIRSGTQDRLILPEDRNTTIVIYSFHTLHLVTVLLFTSGSCSMGSASRAPNWPG